MNALLYKAIAPVLCPANFFGGVFDVLMFILMVPFFVVLLEIMTYPFNRKREFTFENYQYRFAQNVLYCALLICVFNFIQSLLCAAFDDLGKRIYDIFFIGGYQVLTVALVIYDFIIKRRDS